MHRFGLVVLLCCCVTRAADIVLIRQRGGTQQDAQKVTDKFVDTVRRRIAALGIEADTLDDVDVTPGKLSTYRLAVFPHNSSVPPHVVAATESFVASGGKIMLCYSTEPRLLRLVGVASVQYRGSADMPPLGGVRFARGALPGAPAFMGQRSWNINEPRLAPGTDARVAGTWVGQDDANTRLIAATVHNNGLCFSHVLLEHDLTAADQFMLSVLGRFVPSVWPATVRHLLNDVDTALGRTAGAAANGATAARQARSRAVTERARAASLLSGGAYVQALEAANRAARYASDSYLLGGTARIGELRGVWIHSAYGIEGWGWDKTIRVLAAHGFNAIFPNMLWGAVADYPSKVLPVHPRVAEEGDQIAKCLRACRKYGVEMHVWKVNWNMGHHTPKSVRDTFRAAGRTQVHVDGKPSDFLAPHIRENFLLELNALLEVVQKYKVDGIHLDYIRYPNARCDFSDSARRAFEASYGAPVPNWPEDCYRGALRERYNQWRRGNIDRLVKTVYEQAHALRPDISVSAAVFGNWDMSPQTIAQSALHWCRQGWLDFICPMNYNRSNTWLRDILGKQTTALAGRVPLYCGLGTWQHDGAVTTARQIHTTRELGADGFICFQYGVRLAETILPYLSKGVTRGKAGLLPHHSPRVKFLLPPPRKDLPGCYRAGEPLQVTATFAPQRLRRLQARIQISRDGVLIDDGRRLASSEASAGVACTFTPAVPGRYRVELTGYVEREGDQRARPLLARSGPIRVVGSEEARQLSAQSGAPRFRNTGGITVGVWANNAYGSAPLLTKLVGASGVDAAALHNLEPGSLAACQVVILPQPRERTDLFRSDDTARRLADYVKNGGGLLVTHALVGLRGYKPCLPEVARGLDAVAGRTWRTVVRHPLTRGLDGTLHESTFVDRVSLQPGKQGAPIATTENGVPVVAVGQSGKGRYVACGLGIGIGQGDKDVEPSPAEFALVVNSIKWLARR